MDGDGRCSSPTRPTTRAQRTTRKTAWAATSPQERRIESTCKAIQFSPPSEQDDATRTDFRKSLKGDFVMRNSLLVVMLVVGVVVASSFPSNTSSVAADTQHSTAVFDSDGKLKLPTGYRRWVFVGDPLTPNGLNNGKAGFPEYHHVYVEEKNLDVYLKTGSLPEGIVIVKELTRVLDPTFPDGSRAEPSGRGDFNCEFNGMDVTVKDSKRFANTNRSGFFNFRQHPLPYAESAKETSAVEIAACHSSFVAKTDMTWVQVYPILRGR